MKNLISIIIPIYNSEPYLKQCLDSILNQSYQNFEIILVCDIGKDNSHLICEEYKKIYSNIKLIIRDKPSGVSSARNIGIENISPDSEFLSFIDADDWIDKDYYKILLDNILNENADVSTCKWSWTKPTTKNFKKLTNPELTTFTKTEAIKELFLYNYFSGALWQKLIKTSLIGDLRFAEDITYGEDLLFSFNYFLKCDKIVSTNQKLYHYIKNPNSAVLQKFNLKRLSLLRATQSIIEKCNTDFPEQEKYIRSLFFLQLVEQLLVIKKYKFNDEEIINNLRKLAIENKQYYKQVKSEYSFIRSKALLLSKLLKI